MKFEHLQGSIVAMVTPFHEDGSVNFDVLTQLLERQIAAGTDARPSKARLIRQVMEELKWEDRSAAVMIGDSRYDGEGALEAGVDFVPLTYGFGFSEPGSLAGLPTVFTAHTPEELVKFVQEALR